jgi:nitrogen fixation NifU-like protein
VKGKTIEEALEITNRTVTEALGGLPKVKMYCSVLSEQALKAAINDYYKRQGKPSPIDIPEDEHKQCDLSHSGNDEEV